MRPIETIRLSEVARSHLVTLKRRTKIANWNTLCRRAFCVSLAEPTVPALVKILADSSVEMSWRTFGGQHHEVYLALLKERCRADGLELTDEVLSTQFRLHLHRGIDYLFADRKSDSIQLFLEKLLPSSES